MNVQKICGCKYIASSIKNNPLFGRAYDQLVETDTYRVATAGKRPQRMPNPSIKPVLIVSAPDPKQVADLPITWIEVEREGRWGVYHTVHALFGERHWVTQQTNGGRALYVFSDDEHFI